MRSLSMALSGLFLLCTLSFAQDLGPAQAASEAASKAPLAPAEVTLPSDLQDVIKKQFGPTFTVAKSPGKIMMTHIKQEDDTPWTRSW